MHICMHVNVYECRVCLKIINKGETDMKYIIVEYMHKIKQKNQIKVFVVKKNANKTNTNTNTSIHKVLPLLSLQLFYITHNVIIITNTHKKQTKTEVSN